MNLEFWRDKKVFLTGHTGFKGSWMSLWLQQLGADLTGFALHPPTNPSLFEQASVAKGMNSIIGDVRDYGLLHRALKQSQPEIVIHMAAQPLVRYSYTNPVETYATNVMGTVHLLEAVRQSPSVRSVVNVTTDKCYENKEWIWGYRESEPMGGYDPYSSSKGCSELVTSAYRSSYFLESDVAIASARAGNVIGGGDWAQDRLIPDILLAFKQGSKAVIRNPHAIRPWQHVLEPLRGYMMLAEKLYNEGQSFAEAWNFGPRDQDARSVEWIVNELVQYWGGDASWVLDDTSQPHEASWLKLDVSKAQNRLKWNPMLTLPDALKMIVEWDRAIQSGEDVKQTTEAQIKKYQECI